MMFKQRKQIILLFFTAILFKYIWLQLEEGYVVHFKVKKQKQKKQQHYQNNNLKNDTNSNIKNIQNKIVISHEELSGEKKNYSFESSSLRQALVRVQEPAFILYGNRGYKSIMANFVCNMALFPPMHKHILMVVTDNDTAVFLQTLSNDITLFVSKGKESLHEAYDFESPEYLKLMLARGWMLVGLLHEALVQEKTVIWLEPDFYYTQNLLNRTEMMDTISDLVLFWDQEMYCGCFIRFAPVPASGLFYTEIMRRMQDIHTKGGTTNDQILLNDVVSDQLPNFTLFDRCLYRSGTFNTGGYMLEYQLSCTGIQPVAQHHNWIVGAGTKVQMAKAKGGWFMTDNEKQCKTF